MSANDFKLQYMYYTFDVHRLTLIVIVQKNVIALPTSVYSYILCTISDFAQLLNFTLQLLYLCDYPNGPACR